MEEKESYPTRTPYIYVLLDLQYMIAADIILSRVMIKPDYAEKNNDADQPTHLHSLF